MLDELYDMNELQPEFVEETEKPYDKYLKLHNYDPKTNTIEIDGKRVNAGARNISSKERNRMNKVLRENDYDPKTGTYKSDIKVKDPKTGEMKNQRIKLNFDTHGSTHATTTKTPNGMSWDKTHINMEPKDLRKKPKESESSLKHEEGHVNHNNDEEWRGENKSKEIRDIKAEAERANKEDFKNLRYSKNNPQMQHANDPEEKYADLYGELHNKQGFGGRKMSSNRFKNDYKEELSEKEKESIRKDLEKVKDKRENAIVDKDKIINNLMTDDEQYDWLLGKKKDAEGRVMRFKGKLEMSPEDRLENMLGYSPKEIEELKKSGKFEDTLKAEKVDDEFLKSRMKKNSDDASKYGEELKAWSKELLNDEDFQKKAKERIAKEEETRDAAYDLEKRKIHDQLDAKKNFDAEMDSRANFVERKIRELAEKDPEVKKKLAEYDAAMNRRKQKLEKRKANKAEARAKAQASESTTESYYVEFEPEVDIVF